jgi:hypothetical protein
VAESRDLTAEIAFDFVGAAFRFQMLDHAVMSAEWGVTNGACAGIGAVVRNRDVAVDPLLGVAGGLASYVTRRKMEGRRQTRRLLSWEYGKGESDGPASDGLVSDLHGKRFFAVLLIAGSSRCRGVFYPLVVSSSTSEDEVVGACQETAGRTDVIIIICQRRGMGRHGRLHASQEQPSKQYNGQRNSGGRLDEHPEKQKCMKPASLDSKW